MTEEPPTENCTHPNRGRQEHLAGMGTGDYHCLECREAMPHISKPTTCMNCRAQGHIEADPVHGKSWHCRACDQNWGWVSGEEQRR